MKMCPRERSYSSSAVCKVDTERHGRKLYIISGNCILWNNGGKDELMLGSFIIHLIAQQFS